MYPNPALPDDWEMVEDDVYVESALHRACGPELRRVARKTVFYADYGFTREMDALWRDSRTRLGHVCETRFAAPPETRTPALRNDDDDDAAL